MTDTDNLDDLANAIPKSSPKIRAYAVAQAAASQSQELDIRDALSRIAALEVPSPEPEPEPQPEPEPPSPIAYPASYYTGPLGQNNILPTKRGAFLITWGISMPSGSMEWPEQKANILTRESAMGRRYDGLMVLDTPEYWSEGRMEWVRDHGSIPIVAGYGYSLGGIAGIAAGQKDAVIDAQADHWKALGVPLIVRLFHEFDLPGVPYTMQGVAASTWISAWRRIVERVQNRGATNVGFWWCPVEGYDRAKTSAVWPGDEYVDWSGSDNYNAQAHGGTGYVTPLHPGWAEFWELFDYGEAWSGGDSYLDEFGPRKPFVVGETGLRYDPNQPASKGDWYRNIPLALRNMEHCTGVSFFDQNVSPSEPGNNWLVDFPTSNPDCLAGFVQMAQDPWVNTR